MATGPSAPASPAVAGPWPQRSLTSVKRAFLGSLPLGASCPSLRAGHALRPAPKGGPKEPVRKGKIKLWYGCENDFILK